MICRIADFNINILHIHDYIADFCRNYCLPDSSKCDFTVKISEEDINEEIRFSAKSGEYHNETAACMETLAVCRKIVGEMLSRDGFLMHGVLLEHEGRGYLFTANSGTGKTTHIKLWQEVFGDGVHIVNGDKPILRFIDGEVFGYGTPWCGKEGYNINTSVKLCGICFIERDKENSITELDADSALLRVLPQVMIADSADLGKQLELVDRLLCTVPTYLLKCNMDPEAAKVAYNGMTCKDN